MIVVIGTGKPLAHFLNCFVCIRTVFIADPDASGTMGCESRWKSTRGSNFCYKLNQVKMNWTDANAYCKSKGANLVSIESKYVYILIAQSDSVKVAFLDIYSRYDCAHFETFGLSWFHLSMGSYIYGVGK